MMQAFRNAATPVVYLITITFLSWMVLSLSGITGQQGLFSKTSVGSINGRSVDSRIYDQAVQAAITDRQKSSGGTLGLEDVEQVRNQVWSQFIQDEAIRAEIERNRITVTDDEVAAWIRNVPPNELQSAPDFQTSGKFDMGKYQRWLASPVGQQYMPALEQRSREELLREKLFAAITADVFLSDASLWERYKDQHEQVKISLTAILSHKAVPDTAVKIAPSDLESYYAAHKSEFARPRTAFMRFVAVPRAMDASDSAAALARAKQLRAEIAGGAPFADVAKRESADTVSGKNGGDLGTFGNGKMAAEFEKAAFALPVNTLSEPVQTQFGYHLIEVTKKFKDSVTARHILIPIELAGAHRTQVDAEADSLQRLAAERLNGDALDTVARVLKRPMGSTGPVQQGSRVQLGVYVVPDAGVWAFMAKPGETSPVIEGEAAFYVFRLDSLQEAGTPPLNQITDAVMSVVRDKRKDEMAKAIATDLVKRVNGGAKLPDASKALNLPNREFPLFTRINPPLTTPKLVGAAFGIPVGKTSGVIETTDGMYVVQVLEHVPADSAAFLKDRDQLRADLIRSTRQERVRQFMAALAANAKVKDNRNSDRKTAAQLEAAAPAKGSNGP